MYLFLTTSANTCILKAIHILRWENGEKLHLWLLTVVWFSSIAIKITLTHPDFGTVFSGESFQSPRHLLSWDAGNAHLALQPENSVSKTRAFSVQVWSTWDTYTIVTLHSRELSLLCIAIHRPLESTSENEASHLGNLVGKGPCEFQPKPSNHPGRSILSTLHCQKKWQHTF